MMSALHATAYCLVALIALTWLGNVACRMLFVLSGASQMLKGSDGINNAGKLIGGLERLLIALGLIGHSWEVIAAVVALKTLARFKELDKQIKAEYFLIGSLFSLIWAILVTGAWLAYDQRVGTDLRAKVAELVNPKDKTDSPRPVEAPVQVKVSFSGQPVGAAGQSHPNCGCAKAVEPAAKAPRPPASPQLSSSTSQ